MALDVASRALEYALGARDEVITRLHATSALFTPYLTPFTALAFRRVPCIDAADASLARALLLFALAPLIWNIVARFEYRTRLLSRLLLHKYIACNALALWIILFSQARDRAFLETIHTQPRCELLASDELKAISDVSFVVGAVLVAGAYFRLGIFGTYLGDYFGFLMKNKVESFPFNVCENPMYDGACLLFLAKALRAESAAGLLLTLWAFLVYRVAIIFEGGFTTHIYEEAARAGKQRSHTVETGAAPPPRRDGVAEEKARLSAEEKNAERPTRSSRSQSHTPHEKRSHASSAAPPPPATPSDRSQGGSKVSRRRNIGATDAPLELPDTPKYLT